MKKQPFVLCLTNTVAANFTANVLLAIGAKPAMIEEANEAAELAAVSDAVLVNVGTVTPVQADVMRAAIRACTTKGTPWVLDPVAVQALSYRRELVQEFLSANPTLIRGNRDEIGFLVQKTWSPLGSVPKDAGSVPKNAGSVPTDLVVLETGEVDRIYTPDGVEEVAGGVSLLQDVTATGCAQGAVCAAFLGWGQTPENAARLASRLMKKAGERAFEKVRTPGSFQIALLDALYEFSPIRTGK